MDELWEKALFHLDQGNFSALEADLGGPLEFDHYITTWVESGKFEDHPKLLAEALTCACMLGRTETARYLIDAGVDPYAGMKTLLAGPHYAASSGHLDTIRMLIDLGVSLEVRNGYGGTVLGQALWSAVNEHRESHVKIIEALLDAGSFLEPGTLSWWVEQEVFSERTKQRVLDALVRHGAQ